MFEVQESDVFSRWLRGLRDRQGRRAILLRIQRMALGNMGDTKPVGRGVKELRIFSGPGYRVYFVKLGTKVYLLLCGGDKSTQAKDIAKAKRLLADWSEEHG